MASRPVVVAGPIVPQFGESVPIEYISIRNLHMDKR